MAANCNYATWNPGAKTNPGLSYSASIFDNANTRFRGNTGGTASTTSTISMKSGKWYIEVYSQNAPAGGWPTLGILKTDKISIMQNVSNYQGYTSSSSSYRSEIRGTDGKINAFGSTTGASVGGSAWADGDILQIAVDIDGGKWWFGKNNTYFNSGNPAAGSGEVDTFTAGTEMSVWVASYNGSSYMIINAGQSSGFAGNKSSGSANATDGNGFGDFYYTPPSGFNALCQGNVAIDADIDPAQTDDDFIGGKQFGIVTYTGNSTTGQAVTGLGFKPDVVWFKMVDSSQNNQLFHSGVLNSRSPTPTPFMFQMDTTSRIDDTAQGNNNPMVSSFDSDGFTLGTSGSGPNDNGRLYIAWCWRANATTTVSNSDGDRTSTIQVNAEAGFSTGTYTGNLSGSGTATVGHGLGKAPELIISMRSDGNSQRMFRHTGLTSHNYALQVETTGSEVDKSGNGSMSAPNATTFDTNYTDGINTNGHTFIFMAWTSIPGYSAFGRYNGTGNNQGAFVYTGFRPKLVQLRRIDGSGSYLVSNSVRRPFNDEDYRELYWNSTSSEQTGTNTHDGVDYLSNGFRLRGTNLGSQGSNNQYIYSAWADIPFRYSNPF